MAITILLGLIVLGYGALRFFIPRAMLLVIAVLLVWIALANQLPRKHQFDELKDAKVVKLAGWPDRRNPELVDDGVALQGWRNQVRANAPGCAEGIPPKLIVVMTSGGGIRASVWTAAVLRALDLDPCRYGRHIRVITGASGGMVGAGYSVTRKAFPSDPRLAEEDCRNVAECELRAVTADALDGVARYLALRDVPALFLPARIPDRGFALESAWKENAAPMKREFHELRAAERAGSIPSLIYSPASLDDGRRLLLSNLQLDYMTRHGTGLQAAPRSAVLFEIFPADAPLTVATAARMSASFPWVSSAAELPVEELRRIGDAGYFDNYGGFVTAAWLLKNRDWLDRNTSGVLVVQIRDSSFGDRNRNIAWVPDKGVRVTRAFSEAITPLQGAAVTRTSVMRFRNDFDLATVAALFDPGFVQTVEIELHDRVAPLSWNLTRRAASAIIERAQPAVTAKMGTISGWWKADRAPRPEARTPASPESRNATTPTAAGRSRALS